MTMQMIEGFDYLTVANMGVKWDSASGSLVTGVYGRGLGVSNYGFIKTYPFNTTHGFVGFHYFVGTTTATNVNWVQFLDSNTIQCDLRYDSSGTSFFTRNGTAIGSAVSAGNRLSANQWYWIEVEVVIDPSIGVANLWINGTAALTQSSLNTRTTANSFFNQIKLAGQVNGTQIIDSFHFWDTSAGDIIGHMAESIIDTKLANAVGSNASWTKGGTINANNYLQVNEANSDGDTTYVLSSTPGQIDSYGFATLTASVGTVNTIGINTIDRIDDATPRTIKHFTKSSASTVLTPSAAMSPGPAYSNHQSFVIVDPATGVAWTISGRNTAEFGFQEIS